MVAYIYGDTSMTSKKQGHESAIPDLRKVPLDRLAELGGSALAESIMLYRHRMNENSIPLSSFTSHI
jgi:hypothetical protein